MRFDHIKDDLEQKKKESIFLKLDDRQTVKGIFRGDPHPYQAHTEGNKTVPCAGHECRFCKQGEPTKLRFRINFVVNDNGVFKAKIWDQGPTVLNMLKKLHENDYDLEKTIVTITRYGEKLSTTYTILPVANHKVTDEIEKKLREVKLHSLTPQQPQSAQITQTQSNNPDPFEDDIPF